MTRVERKQNLHLYSCSEDSIINTGEQETSLEDRAAVVPWEAGGLGF